MAKWKSTLAKNCCHQILAALLPPPHQLPNCLPENVLFIPETGFPKTFGTLLDILTDEAGVLRWTFHVFVGHLKMSIRFLHFEYWSKCNSYVSNRFKRHFTPHFKWLYFSVDLVEQKILAGHFV